MKSRGGSEGSRQELEPLPLQWDVEKELNSHLGRLGTLLGLIVTAAALTLGSEPIKFVLTSPDSANLAIYANLAILGLCLLVTAYLLVERLSNPLPYEALPYLGPESEIDDDSFPADRVETTGFRMTLADLRREKREAEQIAAYQVFLGDLRRKQNRDNIRRWQEDVWEKLYSIKVVAFFLFVDLAALACAWWSFGIVAVLVRNASPLPESWIRPLTFLLALVPTLLVVLAAYLYVRVQREEREAFQRTRQEIAAEKAKRIANT